MDSMKDPAWLVKGISADLLKELGLIGPGKVIAISPSKITIVPDESSIMDDVVEYFEPFCVCAGPRVYNFIGDHRHCCKCGRMYADD